MNIFAIIVTYNAMRRNWIERCLQSLQESTVPVTPIVVDNGSTDGTRDYVPSQHPAVIWLPQDRNLGFGQANNMGFRYALEHGADCVLLLNQDATLHPKALQRLLEASDGKSLLSPLQLNGEGSGLDFLFKYVLLQADHTAIDDALVGKGLQTYYEGGKYAAACWLIPVLLLQEIGGFNPLFFQYSEDYNYLHRLNYHQYKTRLVPQAHMYHDRNQHGDNAVFMRRLLHRDMLLIACNINLSFVQCLWQWGKLLVLRYVRDLPKRQYLPGSFVYEAGWLIAHAASIRKSREMEKQKGSSWL